MLHAGHTVLAVALARRGGYGLSPAQIGRIVGDGNVDAVHVLIAFLNPAFGLTERAQPPARRTGSTRRVRIMAALLPAGTLPLRRATLAC